MGTLDRSQCVEVRAHGFVIPDPLEVGVEHSRRVSGRSLGPRLLQQPGIVFDTRGPGEDMNKPHDIEREIEDPSEKHVADEIENVVHHATSIEEEMLLEAAEIEEAAYHEPDPDS